MDYDYLELIDGRIVENAFENKDKAFAAICAIYEALHRDVHDPDALVRELQACGMLDDIEFEQEIVLHKVFTQARLRLRYRYRDPELDPALAPLPASLADWQRRPERPMNNVNRDVRGWKVVSICQSSPP